MLVDEDSGVPPRKENRADHAMIGVALAVRDVKETEECVESWPGSSNMPSFLIGPVDSPSEGRTNVLLSFPSGGQPMCIIHGEVVHRDGLILKSRPRRRAQVKPLAFLGSRASGERNASYPARAVRCMGIVLLEVALSTRDRDRSVPLGPASDLSQQSLEVWWWW